MASIEDAFNDPLKNNKIEDKKNEIYMKVPEEEQNKGQNEYMLYNYYDGVENKVFELPIDAYYRPIDKNVLEENKLIYSQYQNKNKWIIEEKTTSGRPYILRENVESMPETIDFLLTTSINNDTLAVEKRDRYGMNTRDNGRKSSKYYKQTNDKHASEENYYV